MITIEGKMSDVGTVHVDEQLQAGIVLELQNCYVTLAGISERECQLLATLYGQRVRITVEKCDD